MKRHSRSALQHAPLPAVDHAAVDRAGVAGGGAVVAGEDDQRVLPQPELLQLGHQRPKLLVHVADVVVVELVDVLRALRRVRRAQGGLVDQVHGVVEEERLVLVPPDEIEGEVLDDVGAVGALRAGSGLRPFLLYFVSQYQPPAVLSVRYSSKPQSLRRLAQLPPFAGLPRGIAGLLHEPGHGVFVGRLRSRPAAAPRLVGQPAGAKGVTPGHQQAARRPAQGRGVARAEAQAGRRQGVDVRRLVVVGAVATDAVHAQIVGKDEDDVGLGRAPRPRPGRTRRQGTEGPGELRLSSWCSWRLFDAEYLDFTNARPAAFVKTRHRDLHVTDLPGFRELQVVDLRRGGGVGLIAQQRPVLPVGRAFDLVPIPFSVEGPADLATGKVARLFQIDLPPLRPALGLVVGPPAGLRIAVVGLGRAVFIVLYRRAARRLVQGQVGRRGGGDRTRPADQEGKGQDRGTRRPSVPR